MAAYILLALFVLMWIVLIVPRQREVRRHRELVASLAEGDEVMTTSGIYGTIKVLREDQVDLEVAPGLDLKVARRAVAAKVPPEPPADEVPAVGAAPAVDGAPPTDEAPAADGQPTTGEALGGGEEGGRDPEAGGDVGSSS